MEGKLLGYLTATAKILAILIVITALIYLFGDVSYIAVPMIVVAALFIYILYDINKRKIPFRKVPDWDTFVEKHDGGHARKGYQRDTRERHAQAGRVKNAEARSRGRPRQYSRR